MLRADAPTGTAAVARRAAPLLVIPVAMILVGLSAAPWLRVFPAAFAGVPLFGAAVLSVLTPVVVAGIGVRRLWLSVLVDVAMYVFFTTLVGLHDPVGFVALWDGLVHGPSEILTFALPFVAPRTLLVAPITLCWVAGTVVGECVGRGWHSVLVYATPLVAFGLGYAGSVRGVGSLSGARRFDVVLAASLLLAMLLIRAGEAWLEQDAATTDTASTAVPVRRLGAGALVAVVLAGAVAAVVGVGTFGSPPVTPGRATPLDRTAPLSPLAFVANLRPHDASTPAKPLFTVRVDRSGSNYVALADVDHYDGQGWTFHRTFHPSGGVIPASLDVASYSSASASSASSGGRPLLQQYTIHSGALIKAPWMPFMTRPDQVAGLGVDVDAASGMVVPAAGLRAGQRYTVASTVPPGTFASLRGAPIDTAPAADTTLPGDVASALGSVTAAFERETGVSDADPVAFLQAVAQDLRTTYTLSGPSADARGQATGGTGFATVLASILGPNRAATPEQFATLVTLMARHLGVPARLDTGFRVRPAGDSLRPGRTYRVTARQAWTWVTIPVQGRGWTVLDAAPSRTGTARSPQPNPAARPTPTSSPTPDPRGLSAPSRHGRPLAPQSTVPGNSDARTSSVLAVGFGLVGVAAGMALAWLWGRKRRRRHRRQHAGDARERVIGAWQESLDLLSESGLPDLAALTAAEAAQATGRRFGASAAAAVRILGERANTAIFSPATAIGAGEADAAWQGYAAIRSTVRDQLTLRQRVGADLRYSRPAPVVRDGPRRELTSSGQPDR